MAVGIFETVTVHEVHVLFGAGIGFAVGVGHRIHPFRLTICLKLPNELQKATMKLQKETEQHGKWYDDACGTAFALELIGERWSLLIVRELLFGGRRFSDLRASLPGISAKVLTERLGGLEQSGILARAKLPPPVSAQVYELTEWGYQAELIVLELGRWAARSPLHDPTLPLSPVSLMLSFRTMLDRSKLERIEGTVGMQIAGQEFVARLEGDLPIARGATTQCDAIFRASAAPVMAALVYGDVPADALESEAGLAIEGDRSLALRFVDCFSLPPRH